MKLKLLILSLTLVCSSRLLSIDVPQQSIGTSLTPQEFNQVPDELENLVESSGQTLSNTDYHQVKKAVNDYSHVGDYYVDVSTISNTYDLTRSSFVYPTSYLQGMTARFIAHEASTDIAKVRIGSLAYRDIKYPDGAFAKARAISNIKENYIVYRSTWFVLEENYGIWQRIHSEVLTSTQTNILIDNLDGDSDWEYKVRCKLITEATTYTSGNFELIINEDSSPKYAEQYVRIATTTITAFYFSTNSYITVGRIDNYPPYAYVAAIFEANIFAKNVADTGIQGNSYYFFLSTASPVATPYTYRNSFLYRSEETNLTSIRLYINEPTIFIYPGSTIEVWARR